MDGAVVRGMEGPAYASVGAGPLASISLSTSTAFTLSLKRPLGPVEAPPASISSGRT